MAETVVTVETTMTDTAEETTPVEQEQVKDESPEIAKLKAEIAKLNNKNNALAKENADQKKRLRASQSAEEQRAEEEKERNEAIENELKTLRKQAALSGISKKVMTFIGDETVSNTISEALYGAEDVDAVLDEIKKAWTAREKKLRMEYGKIPAPDAGDGAPQTSAADLSKMSYRERLDFKQKYPDTYKKLTT